MLDNIKISADMLGDTYYRIAEIIGVDETLKLADALSGQQMRFNKSYDLEQDYKIIVECVGKNKAEKIVRAFQGEGHIYFTSAKTALKPFIYDNIRKEFTGYNHMELARKYEYSARHIRKILANEHI